MAILGSTDLGDGRLYLTVDHDPTVVATDALAGSLIYSTSTSTLYEKLDDGSTTNVAAKDNPTDPRTDPDAIHDNVANEFDPLTEKVGPVGTDLLLVEDSAGGGAKVKVQIGNLPTAGGGDNVSVNGVGASDANFSDTTPAAPGNAVNVAWQKDTAAPDNISASVQAGDENQRGVLELATQAEVDAEASTSLAVSVRRLASADLTTRKYKTGAAAPAHAEGNTFWDDNDHTLAQHLDEADITQQLGQEFYIRVFNNSGVTITNGSIVYVSGTEATENRPTIALARSDAESTSEVIGWATHDIENNTYGYVTAMGLVNDVDTSGLTAGDTLYLDEATAGAFRSTPPPEGNFKVLVGYAIRVDAVNGRVLVFINAELGLQVGDAEELVLPVVKDSAGTINPGEVVRIAGFNVGQGRASVELAQANAAGTMPAFGIARDTITNSQVGLVVMAGRLINQDTSAFADGDDIYVSSAVAGALVNTKPTGAANFIQKIGQVIRANVSNGVIEVFGPGQADELPNLADGNLWLGNGSDVPTPTSRSGIDDTAIHTGDAAGGDLGGTYPNPTVNDGADGTAIHDNVAGEINAVTEKVSPGGTDVLLIEDALAGFAKKKVQIANLPGGGGNAVETWRWVVNGKPQVSTLVDGAFIVPRAGTIISVTLFLRVRGASAGNLIVDVHKNGTTIFTTQGNRPTIAWAAGNNAIDRVTNMDVTAVAQNDRLQMDIDDTHDGNPLDVTVMIELEWT
jgi:hypothetical protein